MKITRVQGIIIVVIGLVIMGGGYLYITTVLASKKITWYTAMLDEKMGYLFITLLH